jgi:hypothetical protein
MHFRPGLVHVFLTAGARHRRRVSRTLAHSFCVSFCLLVTHSVVHRDHRALDQRAEHGRHGWRAGHRYLGRDARAVVNGDFAYLRGEVQATRRTLRKAGINIVAIHSHIEDASPRVIFLHYWGVGPVAELVKRVKLALDAQKEATARPDGK